MTTGCPPHRPPAAILEGEAHRLTADEEPGLLGRIAQAYVAKYDVPHDPPYWILRPSVVFGWAPFPATATKWTYRQSEGGLRS